MPVRIRPVREEDAAAIAALLNPIIEAGIYTIIDRPISVEDQAAFIRALPERGFYHAAVSETGGEVLGIQDVLPLAAAPGTHAHVGEISTFVSLGARGGGIGSALCRASFPEASRRGFRKLWAAIRADNEEAVSFYRSRGFRIVGAARKHALVRGALKDQILAEKLLDERED